MELFQAISSKQVFLGLNFVAQCFIRMLGFQIHSDIAIVDDLINYVPLTYVNNNNNYYYYGREKFYFWKEQKHTIHHNYLVTLSHQNRSKPLTFILKCTLPVINLGPPPLFYTKWWFFHHWNETLLTNTLEFQNYVKNGFGGVVVSAIHASCIFVWKR